MYRIVHSRKTHQRIRRSLQLAALDELLPDRQVEALCRQRGHRWRNRKLPPGPTVRSLVFRGLHPDHSIAGMLADLAGRWEGDTTAPTDSAWCQARSRLPEGVLTDLILLRARQCRRRFGRPYCWHDRWVFRIDGSTVSMPDEPTLAETFGYADNNHGPSRFPLARITFVELAGLNVIWNYRLGAYRCSEETQLQQMWSSLPAGCMCLLDRKFCSFYLLAKFRQRGIGVVTPLHASRDPHALIRRGCPLGPDDWLVPLDLASPMRRQYADPSLPRLLWVRLLRVRFWRGRRHHTLWLVATLIDPDPYPAAELAQLYRSRWDIEPRIGALKTTLEMDVLRGKSPDAVRREVAAIILGHNLVWTLMHEAAQTHQTPAADLSFAGAVKTVLAFSPALQAAGPKRRRELRQRLLCHIAHQTNHHPFGRVEPRQIKRCTAHYPFLHEPRRKARLKCLS
jgi:hypothetical protein